MRCRGTDRCTALTALIALSMALASAAVLPGQEPEPASQAACDHSALFDLDVVDLHAHFLNLHYVPLRGVLYRFGVPWPLAGILARALDALTLRVDLDEPGARCPELAASTLAEMERVERMGRMSDKELYDSMKTTLRSADPRAVERLDNRKRKMRKALMRIRLDKEVPGEKRKQRRQEMKAQYAEDDGVDLLWEMLYQTMFHQSDLSPPSLKSSEAAEKGIVRGFFAAVSTLRSDECTIVRRAIRDYPEVDLFVHHMLDLQRIYRNAPELRFRRQIRRARALSESFPGKLHFFVAADLFRDTELLDLVEEGVENGAIGLKYYPPNGHRPSKTDRPPKPRLGLPITASIARKLQFRGRYHRVPPERLDELNLELFEKAAKEELVVFSHHNRKGFEAGKGYGRLMGAPCYWQRVFDELSRRGVDPTKLTVILGHSGGTREWFGDEEPGGSCRASKWDGSFAQQAYNLCVLYENVYCDFGFPSLVLEPDCRDNFARRLQEFVDMPADPGRPIPADLCGLNENAEPRYPIGKKIAYGSDWLVSLEADRRDFACRFDDIFQREGLKRHRADFFGGNARTALGLGNR